MLIPNNKRALLIVASLQSLVCAYFFAYQADLENATLVIFIGCEIGKLGSAICRAPFV